MKNIDIDIEQNRTELSVCHVRRSSTRPTQTRLTAPAETALSTSTAGREITGEKKKKKKKRHV